MFKKTSWFKKIALGALVVALGLAAFPALGASAAGLNDQTTPPANQPNYARLQQVWAREQSVYQREGNALSKASGFITKAQALLDKATAKGWDTSAVQAALNAFAAAIPAAQTAHDAGASIISSHAGFDADGNVTDRATALQTVKDLRDVLKNTRTAMNGTGKALHEAIKALREAHPRPTPTATP
ncbi:MAG TPA: hypothetical protein VMC09_07560 [Anaerolineales bacterium]|nr:hypothetical protein [Anaerolineales bacterium]